MNGGGRTGLDPTYVTRRRSQRRAVWRTGFTKASVAALLGLAAATVSACGSDSPKLQEQGASRISASCVSAWEQVAEVGSFRDTPETYTPTLSACGSMTEWERANDEYMNGLGGGAEALDRMCRNSGTSSELCDEASSKVPTTLTNAAEVPSNIDVLTCRSFFSDLTDAGKKLNVTDALLRRLNPANPDFNLSVSLDFGSAVEERCDPDGDGASSSEQRVADVAAQIYASDPYAYGGSR